MPTLKENGIVEVTETNIQCTILSCRGLIVTQHRLYHPIRPARLNHLGQFATNGSKRAI